MFRFLFSDFFKGLLWRNLESYHFKFQNSSYFPRFVSKRDGLCILTQACSKIQNYIKRILEKLSGNMGLKISFYGFSLVVCQFQKCGFLKFENRKSDTKISVFCHNSFFQKKMYFRFFILKVFLGKQFDFHRTLIFFREDFKNKCI
jgi:hypothetical protein